jgi:hypothetical protein
MMSKRKAITIGRKSNKKAIERGKQTKMFVKKNHSFEKVKGATQSHQHHQYKDWLPRHLHTAITANKQTGRRESIEKV